MIPSVGLTYRTTPSTRSIFPPDLTDSRDLFPNEQLDFRTDAIFPLPIDAVSSSPRSPTYIHGRQLPGQTVPFSCTHFSEKATVGRTANDCHDLADGPATVSLTPYLQCWPLLTCCYSFIDCGIIKFIFDDRSLGTDSIFGQPSFLSHILQ